MQMRISYQLKTIQRLAAADSLLNLPNRKSFERRLHEEWDIAYRGSTCIAMLVIDIDNFWAYNDAHGHKQGDAALTAAAGTVTGCLDHPGGFTARWGGNAFVVFMPDTDWDGAQSAAERIRAAAEKTAIPGPSGEDTFITVSIGVCAGKPEAKGALDKFISYADAALRLAKKNGRNRIGMYESAGNPQE
jgi:diguanylate cyclase (GGDEF)-like protein